MSEPTALQRLECGDVNGLIHDLTSREDSERQAILKELKPAAIDLKEHLGQRWPCRLTDDHERAVLVVLYPSLKSLLKNIPDNDLFIKRDIPRLFPDDLDTIFETWADLVQNNPKFSVRGRAVLDAEDWIWIHRNAVEPTPAVIAQMLFRTNAASRYHHLIEVEPFAHELLKAAFHTPGTDFDCFARCDEDAEPLDSYNRFLIPSLIRGGLLIQDEVIEWCHHAINMSERSDKDRQWFVDLLADLEEKRIEVADGAIGQWWLDEDGEWIED